MAQTALAKPTGQLRHAPGCGDRSLSRYGRQPFHDVALVGGSLYLEVMRGLLPRFPEIGAIVKGASISEINDSIGRMRQRLRTWLETTPNLLHAATGEHPCASTRPPDPAIS